MLCAAMIFTTVTTFLRHLARARSCGHTILRISEKKRSKYKSEGNFSHMRKPVMTCVILA